MPPAWQRRHPGSGSHAYYSGHRSFLLDIIFSPVVGPERRGTRDEEPLRGSVSHAFNGSHLGQSDSLNEHDAAIDQRPRQLAPEKMSADTVKMITSRAGTALIGLSRPPGTSCGPIGHQDVQLDAFTLHGPGGSETAPPWSLPHPPSARRCQIAPARDILVSDRTPGCRAISRLMHRKASDVQRYGYGSTLTRRNPLTPRAGTGPLSRKVR